MTTSAWKAASSIIIMSRSTGRVLLMRRGAEAKFMPNAFVFPGGVATASDEKIGPPTKISALREVFEETGLLITSSGVVSAVESTELASLQDRVQSDSSHFSKAFSSSEVPLDSLIEWNTWLTPSRHARRYMTSFFILPLDGEPQVRMCEKEMSEYRWMDPSQCLDDAYKGVVTLPPPQVYELTRLLQIPKNRLSDYGNTTHVICPQSITGPDKKQIINVLPGDHLYIEDDNFNQPDRKMELSDLCVNPSYPTHRQIFQVKPLYSKCQIFLHKLNEKYRKGFHYFETHSKSLVE